METALRGQTRMHTPGDIYSFPFSIEFLLSPTDSVVKQSAIYLIDVFMQQSNVVFINRQYNNNWLKLHTTR